LMVQTNHLVLDGLVVVVLSVPLHSVVLDLVIYSLSLHDALPIFSRAVASLNILSEYCLPFVKIGGYFIAMKGSGIDEEVDEAVKDRKSTRLNSSHVSISYAVFCLKQKILLIPGRCVSRQEDSRRS